MKTITAVGVAAVGLSLVLAGCSPDEKASTATTSATPGVWTGSPAPADGAGEGRGGAADAEAPAAGATLHQYIVDNKIAEVPFRKDEAGTPTIDFPFPPDWVSAGDKTPEWAYGAIVYDKADDPEDPPYMYAIASKLTGDVDPAKILRYAPTQLNDLPEFTPLGEPEKDSLGGFEAINYIGSYVRDGKPRSVGQQTVVIPGKDALFVLQINAESPKGQEQSVIDAFTIISDETTITVPS